MWPAKLPGEGALLVDACRAMCDVMKELGIAIDGGKDSLSMAARVHGNTVKAPGKDSHIYHRYTLGPFIRRIVCRAMRCIIAIKLNFIQLHLRQVCTGALRCIATYFNTRCCRTQ